MGTVEAADGLIRSRIMMREPPACEAGVGADDVVGFRDALVMAERIPNAKPHHFIQKDEYLLKAVVTFRIHVDGGRRHMAEPCYSSPMIDISHEYRKRPRAFLGAGISALSFIAAIAISSAANKSVEVWSVRGAQAAGVQLEPSMLSKVKVYLPSSLSLYLPASHSIAHQILTVGVGAGELIPRSGVSATPVFHDQRELPLKILKSDLPENLQGNDLVDLYLIPTKDGAAPAGGAVSIARGIRTISVDNRARDLGGDIGVLFDIDDKSIIDLLSKASSGRVVVVRHGR